MIKVVLWDVDGTLLDFLTAEKNAIRKCFSIFHLGECTDEMLADYSAVNVGYWQRLERGEMTKPEIQRGRFETFFSHWGLDPSLAERFNDEYEMCLTDTVIFLPGALETVRALRGRALQCAVTNGTKQVQELKFLRSGLDTLLDHIFISEDVGAEKPSPRFFRAVFDTIGSCDPREVMIVGDSLTSDMRGGVNAGIVTCWYNPLRKENTSDLALDWEIRDIPQLLDII